MVPTKSVDFFPHYLAAKLIIRLAAFTAAAAIGRDGTTAETSTDACFTWVGGKATAATMPALATKLANNAFELGTTPTVLWFDFST